MADTGSEVRALQSALGTHYAIEREIGHGGMATVYLAHDVRHGRPVAVKVLHAELAAVLGAERFLAEIRTTAALQHPHILPLFDSGSATGQLYYVMPYVAGETLRARLARERQLPVADAVRIATEVASALDYAHRHGVIHRDIKPENILLGEDGQALVADFGIALAVAKAGGERMTQTGLSLGTPQYMAPEQAAAERTLDARVDVYALGAVTYEMLAGEPPFVGPSAQAVIAKLMTEDPKPITAVRRSVPAFTDAAVQRALEKVPADRFASAGAFAAALSAPAATDADPAHHYAPLRVAGRDISPAMAALLAAGLLVAGIGGGLSLGRAVRETPNGSGAQVPSRFDVGPDSGTLGSGNWWYSTPAISPDGRTIVSAASTSSGARLYARAIDEIVAHPIAGTDGGDGPFFSPDGEWLAFSAAGGRTLKKVRLDGGTPVLVADLPPSDGIFLSGTWNQSDTIYYGVFATGSALYQVSAAGGIPTRVMVKDSSRHLLDPSSLPNARALLVTSTQDWRVGRIAVLDLATGEVHRFNAGTGAHYVDGQLVWAGAAGALYRQPFDLDRLAPRGTPEEIASGLDVHYAAFSPFDISRNGSIVYRVGRGSWKLSIVDRTGRVQTVLSERFPWSPRFSPNGDRIAYSALTPGEQGEDMWSGDVWHTDILVSDLSSGTVQRLTTDGDDNNEPVWSPDGRSIAFDAGLLGTKDIFTRALGGGSARPLAHGAGDQLPDDWSTDGSTLLFEDASAGLSAQSMRGGPPQAYATAVAYVNGARLSPDGRWLAYTSETTGRSEVYLQPYPGPGRAASVSTGGGTNPAWRRDGRELYYWEGDQLLAATLEPSVGLTPPRVRARTPLFRAVILGSNFDASPDGTRFAIVGGGPLESRLVVALNALGSTRSHGAARPVAAP
ncbi:MAG: protein kinase domain-containing protein [Gemmatimonadaceae bacterium]